MDDEARLAKGRELLKEKKIDDAINIYWSVIAIRPNLTLPYFVIGLEKWRLGKTSECLDRLTRWIELDPTNEKAWELFFRLSMASGRGLEAIGHCRLMDEGTVAHLAASLIALLDHVSAATPQEITGIERGRMERGGRNLLRAFHRHWMQEPANKITLILLQHGLIRIETAKEIVRFFLSVSTVEDVIELVQARIGERPQNRRQLLCVLIQLFSHVGDTSRAAETVQALLALDNVPGHLLLQIGMMLAELFSEGLNRRGYANRAVFAAAVCCLKSEKLSVAQRFDSHVVLWSMYDKVGFYRNAVSEMRAYCALQEKARSDLRRNGRQTVESTSMIIPRRLISHIGTMLHIDLLIRARELDLVEQCDIKVEDGWRTAANPHYLNYLAKFITVNPRPRPSKPNQPEDHLWRHDVAWYMKTKSGCKIIFDAASGILNRWAEAKRPPLLALTTDDCDWARVVLPRLGIPAGAWHVCFHVRDDGFRDPRNANIASYLPAMMRIVERGGVPVRMGSRAMPKIEDAEKLGIIDYAHSPLRSDRLDVVLGALCRFFVGTSSGGAAPALSFDRPTIHTNYLPSGSMFFVSPNMFLPKLLRRRDTATLLSFSQMFSDPYNAICTPHLYLYDRYGVDWIDNTADELADAVSDFYDRLTHAGVPEQESEFQARFRLICRNADTVVANRITCPVPESFLARHAALL